MIKDQRIADMGISLGSIDPCFSCTDRMEIVDIRTGQMRLWSPSGAIAGANEFKVNVRKSA